MRNPFIKTLTELRRRIMTAPAAVTREADAELCTNIGKLAGVAVRTHNVALLATAFALAARYGEQRGVDPGPFISRLEKTWGESPSAVAFCSACGRAYRHPENVYAWQLSDVVYNEGQWEVIAVCSSACSQEIADAGWPGYISFATHAALEVFARRRGIELPAAAVKAGKAKQPEKRPS